MLHKAGRGTNFNYDLSYDSSVWYPVTSGGTTSRNPRSNWGWDAQAAVTTGYVTNALSVTKVCYTGRTPTGEVEYLGSWKYIDQFGTLHSFSGQTTFSWGTCGSTQSSINTTATDGSGYTLSATGNTVNSVTSRSGAVFLPPLNNQSGIGSATDRNGNQITVSGTGVFTDTLGTTALTVSGSGTPASPMTFTYTAPSGASASYTMKYTAYTVQTNFGCSGITEYSPTSNNLVSEIDLPDSTKYTFTYEPTPGHTGNVTGRLASVTLPTGGTISYTYSGGNNGITCADGSTATLTRTTPDGTRTYAHSESGTAWTTTVTDAASKKRQSTIDSLGRLTQVTEDPGGLGYVTTYSYDALSNLTNVTQNGGRQRTLGYDALSRLTSEANPESGTVTYGYDNAGNLTSRQAPAPNQTGSATVTTTSSYDALNRPTQKSYSDGTTLTAFFAYEQASAWGTTLTNPVGRLTEEWTGTSCCATGGAEIFSYDPVDRIVLDTQYTPNLSYRSVNYTYDLAGDMTSYTNGVGVTFTQSFDTAGRVSQLTSNDVDAQHPATLATVDSSVGYYPIGGLRKMTLGNSLTQTAAFNKNLQPCRINANSSATALGACADAIPSGNMQDSITASTSALLTTGT